MHALQMKELLAVRQKKENDCFQSYSSVLELKKTKVLQWKSNSR